MYSETSYLFSSNQAGVLYSVVMYWYLSNETRDLLFGLHPELVVSNEAMPPVGFTLIRECVTSHPLRRSNSSRNGLKHI
jgi:hypothetical protein